MKAFLSGVLIFIGVFSSSAQNITNASFENWHPYSLGEYPDFWSTSDSIAVALFGGTSVYKGNDSYDGTASLHLKSVLTLIGNIKGPGVATNGNVAFAGTFVFSGGTPDTSRSRFFTGWYKYLPTNSTDAAIVKVYLLKYNVLLSKRDTIAEGSWEHVGVVNTYDQFIIPMIFRDFISQPDTNLIVFQSSRGINDSLLGVGSEFIVDSIGFSGFVNTNELQNAISSVNVFPTPAQNEINIDIVLKTKINLSYEIFDINGRLVQISKMNSTKEKVDVSDLSSGKYILKLEDAKKNILYSTQFSIAR